MSRREAMIHHKFSESAKDLIRLHGGEPPPDHNLTIENVEIDTDGKSIRFIYDFIPIPKDPEEDT